MNAYELGLACMELGSHEDACRAFRLAVNDSHFDFGERYESALCLLQLGNDYHASYDCFLELYNSGYNREDILSVMTEAFYLPNEEDLRHRYKQNCRLLRKYPYFFEKSFPKFEDLQIRFFPYDDGQYYPMDMASRTFGARYIPDKRVIDRPYFSDLEKPIYAEDVRSQYALEYLNDNVRPSEWIGKDNHIYLHYASADAFFSYLQVLDLKPLLSDEKFVFLLEGEDALYPLDFEARFGIDYSQYPVKRVGIREINRLIWHVQLSSHNGGDFFNEVLDDHPNLITQSSYYLSSVIDYIRTIRDALDASDSLETLQTLLRFWNEPELIEELYRLEDVTDKDIFVAIYMGSKLLGAETKPHLEQQARIAPALLFQPHFPNIYQAFRLSEDGYAIPGTQNLEEIRAFAPIGEFKYLKSFVPLRRFTTSYGGSIRFQANAISDEGYREYTLGRGITESGDTCIERVLNRSFMVAPDDPLYEDSVVVRFEDSKLNPRATFGALAAFLDIPYTNSMTYCSEGGVHDRTAPGNDIGFDTAGVFRTYDDLVGRDECAFIEYCLRDAYAYYGYDFHYYDGRDVDEAQMQKWFDGFQVLDKHIETVHLLLWTTEFQIKNSRAPDQAEEEEIRRRIAARMDKLHEYRWVVMKAMLLNLRYISPDGKPVRMLPMLQPDPNLMVQPLYH